MHPPLIRFDPPTVDRLFAYCSSTREPPGTASGAPTAPAPPRMPAPAQTPAQLKAPAVQEVAPAACTAATADGSGTDSDGGHVTPETAAAGGKAFKANKKCPCPNCRPPAPAAPAPAPAGSASAKPGKGAGSYGANVKRGGEGDMVWQLGKSAAQQGRKQQQKQQQGGGKAAAAAAQGAKAAAQGSKAAGKGGKGKGGKQFDVKALPAKPLMAAPTGKQVTEAKASGRGRRKVHDAECSTEAGQGRSRQQRQPSAGRFVLLNGLNLPPLSCSPSQRSPRRASRCAGGGRAPSRGCVFYTTCVGQSAACRS